MEGHRYTKKIKLRKDAIRQDGMAPLYLQCFINGDHIRIHLGIHVMPKHWNPSVQELTIPEDPEMSGKINSIIWDKKRRAEMITLNAIQHEQPLTGRMFKERFLEESQAGKLINFMDDIIEQEKPIKAEGTIQNYQKVRRKLERFKDDLRFTEINIELIEEWDRYLHSFDYETNTVAGYHKILRKFLYQAKKKKLIKENPYTDFKIQKARTSRVFLTEDEVQTLINLYVDHHFTEAKHRILRGFLFMCHTGLRFNDLKELRHSEIHSDSIHFRAGKTRRTKMGVNIPLNDHAKRLIKDAREDTFYKNDIYAFDMPSNQKTNKGLSVISDAAGITKHITSHVGRHTFATLFLAAGGDVRVLQLLLDHEDISTTMVYAHIMRKQKIEGLNNLGDMFQFPEARESIMQQIEEDSS